MASKTREKMTPVPVTRGSGERILTQKLDWIEGTFKGENFVSLPQSLSHNFVETSGFHSYTSGERFEDGRMHLKNELRPEMGEHIIWSGEACDNCPVDTVTLIQHLIDAKFSFTRIDMAIDAINFKLRPQRATKELKLERCKTRAKKSDRQDDPRDVGYTQYIGRKASEIYLRIYDKAAEMGVNADHTRIELVVKGRRAEYAARQIVQSVDYRAMVRAYADFPAWRQWRRIMDVKPIKLPSQRKETSTERWLLGTCAPALARAVFLADSTGLYEKFTNAFLNNLKLLSDGEKTVH